MTYVKINGTLYPATINGNMEDRDWDNRESKAITLEMDYATAIDLFVDGLAWSIFEQREVPIFKTDENGNLYRDEAGGLVHLGTEVQETEYDNSEYTIAGDIIDHRDGRITAKMGKLTDLEEAYEIMLGGI